MHSITVSSIFVNPTQFNDPIDFEKYPVTIEKDCELLEQENTDLLFLPSASEMYPNGFMAKHHYELGYLENILEGLHRPGHFQGVCQVVDRLLRIIKPMEIFIGQKDFQQCMVIKKVTELMMTMPVVAGNQALRLDENAVPEKIKVNIVSTFRESDGLAMSSRNVRLGEKERQIAPAIFKQLQMIKDNFHVEPFTELKTKATIALLLAGFTKVDYIEIADADTLQIQTEYIEGKKTVALVAAVLGEVRLIDNLLLN
jgi:pantoate--beta-alanine ligase